MKKSGFKRNRLGKWAKEEIYGSKAYKQITNRATRREGKALCRKGGE